MKCEKCGNEIADNSIFCGNCGNKLPKQQKKFCGNCGAEIHNDAEFCGNCGNKLSSTVVVETRSESIPKRVCPSYKTEWDDVVDFGGECGTNQDTYISSEKNSKDIDIKATPIKRKKYNLIIFILVLIIIILLSGFGSYIYYTLNNDNGDSQTSKGIQTEYIDDTQSEKNESAELESVLGDESEAESEVESKDVSEDVSEDVSKSEVTTKFIDSKGYAVFENTVYDYECKYPSWFDVTYENGSILNCESKDGKAKMQVQSTNSEYSIQETLDNYISSYNNVQIDYKSVGDSYFAIRLKNEEENMYYYRYSEFVDGLVHSYTLDFPIYEFETYDEIINNIYADFSKQF